MSDRRLEKPLGLDDLRKGSKREELKDEGRVKDD
jgi:hypothetical protein